MCSEPARGTTRVSIVVHLDRTSPQRSELTFDVWDGCGRARRVALAFEVDPSWPEGWIWHATADDAGLSGQYPGRWLVVAQGVLAFDLRGGIDFEVQDPGFNPWRCPPAQPMDFTFGGRSTGLARSTTGPGGFHVRSVRVDGRGPGTCGRAARANACAP